MTETEQALAVIKVLSEQIPASEADTVGVVLAAYRRGVEDTERKFKEIIDDLRPNCEACGNPALILYDSQGEGRFWLCASRDRDHDDEHFTGTIVRDLREAIAV